MKIKRNIKIVLVALCTMSLFQCTDVLDKTDLGNITEDKVTADPVLAEAGINLIYRNLVPGWPVNGSANSDDAFGRTAFLYGRITENSTGGYGGSYNRIREINIALENLEVSTFDQEIIDELRGQALFFRALVYWRLVNIYGGVPIVTRTFTDQDPVEDLQIARSSTSETVNFIVSDLDEAIALLPNVYAANDLGRITKGAAMAVKGEILMWFASELFDPAQSQGRWQAAYTALTEAKSNLDANGKGLHPDYNGLWFDDSPANPEVIWGRLYNMDRAHGRDGQVRQFQPGIGGAQDTPTISLLDTYPMKDGKKITDNTSSYTYDPVLIWNNRDPRFAATFAWNGAVYPVEHDSPFRTNDQNWSYQRNTTNIEADAAVTRTGFLTRKAVDLSLTTNESAQSQVQWIEMRYAELLLNLAEAANEVGNGSEALDILMDIRERAGIENNDGRYGLDAGLESDQDAMREAVLNERRIELAMEADRPGVLKRRRMYESLNGTERMGYYIEATPVLEALTTGSALDDRIALENAIASGNIDLNDPVVYETYFTTQVYSIEENSDEPGQVGTPINFDSNYYFFDIPLGGT